MEGLCKNPYCTKRIRELEEELNRIRSVGFDMLKQRGNWQATGTEPAQLGTEFDSIFTHEVEDISELLVEKSEMTESDARKFISTAFQDVYHSCKETVLDQMRDALARILVLPKEHESDEDLYDICRAYGLLLNVCCKSQFQETRIYAGEVFNKFRETLKEFEKFVETVSQFSYKLLLTVPPLVSETIHGVPFCKDWHEKELSPEWNKDLIDYHLVYYRPILFFSYEAKVSQKGWVGNKALLGQESNKCDALVCKTTEVKSKDIKHGHTSYKKPNLRVYTSPDTASSIQQSDHAAGLDEVPEVSEQPPESFPTEYCFGLKKYV